MVAIVITSTGFATAGAGYDLVRQSLQLLGANDIDVGVGPLYAIAEREPKPGTCDYSQILPRSSKVHVNTLLGMKNEYLPYSPIFWQPEKNKTATVPGSAAVYAKHVAAGVSTVLTLGPMTSLADFKAQNPTLYGRLTHLYSMLGAVFVRGNIWTIPENEVSEVNALLDPHAARDVINNSTNWESIVLVPLDATKDVLTTADYVEALASLTTPEGELAYQIALHEMSNWRSRNAYFGLDSNGVMTPKSRADARFMWDVTAAAVMANPNLGQTSHHGIEVVASTPANLTADGWTRPSSRGANVTVVTGVPAANAELLRRHVVNVYNRTCIHTQVPSIQLLLRMAERSPPLAPSHFVLLWPLLLSLVLSVLLAAYIYFRKGNRRHPRRSQIPSDARELDQI